MTPSDIFSLANMTVMPMWLLMIILPKWRVTTILTDYKVIPVLLSILYAVYIIISIKNGGIMDFSNLKSVMELFTKEDALLAGWIHYLAFDLLVGIWMLDKNKTIKIHQLLMAPCLFFTFMFGPVGFLLFTIIKSLKK